MKIGDIYANCSLMQLSANWGKLMQIGVILCKLVQIGVNWCKLGVNWYKLLQIWDIDANWGKLMQIAANYIDIDIYANRGKLL